MDYKLILCDIDLEPPYPGAPPMEVRFGRDVPLGWWVTGGAWGWHRGGAAERNQPYVCCPYVEADMDIWREHHRKQVTEANERLEARHQEWLDKQAERKKRLAPA
jgi:hypothetical protein